MTKPQLAKSRTKVAATRSKVAVRKPAAGSRAKSVGVGEIGEWIRDRIRFGRFAPGQRLVEADIIRELSASRGRVREALQRLATEGVVTIEEFRGASVKHLTRSEVQQMYRARMALEGVAAAEFAGAGTAALKKRLAGVQEELNALEHLGNHEQFARLNDEWHRLIIEGSGNQYIKGFVERLRVPVYRLLFSTFYNARRIDKANAGHRKITAAIVAGRVKDAERLMRDHIEEGLAALNTLGAEFFN